VIGESYPLQVPTDVGNVQVYDADLGDQDGLTGTGVPVADSTIESSVAAIHATGAHAICYVDAGTAEDWRSDYGEFAASVLGGNMPDWPGEKFINVTDWAGPAGPGGETLAQIMTDRVTLCQEEGFDAVEMDNVDAYTDGNLGGFTLSMAQEETYLDNLIGVVHGAGMAFFLKNEVDGDSLLATMAPRVDGEIVEQCWQYDECSQLEPFVQEGKPVLNVEYQSFAEATLCPEALAFPMATIQTDLDLNGDIAYGCWQYGGTTTTTAATTTTTAATTTTTTAATPTSTTAATTSTTHRTTTTTAATTTTTTRPLTTPVPTAPAPGPATIMPSPPPTTTTTAPASPPTTARHHRKARAVTASAARSAPVFTSPATVRATPARELRFEVKASGYPAPVLSHSVLPDGLKWVKEGDGEAIIWGTPRAAAKGVFKVWLRAFNAMGTGRQLLIISVRRASRAE
jgi:hypothetical protein